MFFSLNTFNVSDETGYVNVN